MVILNKDRLKIYIKSIKLDFILNNLLFSLKNRLEKVLNVLVKLKLRV